MPARPQLSDRLRRLTGAAMAIAVTVAFATALTIGRLPARAEGARPALPTPVVDVRGVRKVLAGYAGGAAATAHYETVSGGDTGHAESVQVQFDPKQISYGRILQIFFSVALDPTEVNEQGPDEGTQYRSEIFVADIAQQRAATAYIAQLDRLHVFTRPIATRVDPLTGFYPAEAYHQDYLERHPDQPYIATNDMPKVENLKRLFPEDFQEKPVLAMQTP
jgi:peptide-methionine (S)-S-oxide reductase